MLFTEKMVKEAADKCTTEEEFVVAMFEALYCVPWDSIKSVSGFAKCGKEVSDLIWKLATEFAVKANPNGFKMPGLWFNYGFSTDNDMKPWEVEGGEVELTYTPDEVAILEEAI